MTACTRTRAIKPTLSFRTSQPTAIYGACEAHRPCIVTVYPINGIKNNINALHIEEKSSLGGSTNQPREHLPTLEDGK